MNDEPDVSPELRQALGDLAARDPLVIPDAVDARLRAAARTAGKPRGRLLSLRRALTGAAAALLLGFGLWAALDGPADRAPDRGVALVPGDLDANGRVDIVDAYLLDRRLATPGGDRPSGWDLNADGRVDGADVRRLAERAVSLDGGNG